MHLYAFDHNRKVFCTNVVHTFAPPFRRVSLLRPICEAPFYYGSYVLYMVGSGIFNGYIPQYIATTFNSPRRRPRCRPPRPSCDGCNDRWTYVSSCCPASKMSLIFLFALSKLVNTINRNRNMPLTNTYHMKCLRILTRRCRHWDPLNRMTGCLVALVTCVLHAENRFIVAVLWVVQHNVSHVDVGERMTTSKTGRLIYVHSWTLWSRGWVEALQTITNRQTPF